MIRCLVWMMLLLAATAGLQAQPSPTLKAWLDRDTITLGETVTLNVEIDGSARTTPDLAALAPRFRVAGTSSSTQASIGPGGRRVVTLWAVALEPTEAGVHGIPSLAFGSEATPPLTVTVRPAPTVADAGPGDDVFLDIEVDTRTPYVSQQVRYTVRLHYAVQLLEGHLDEPQVDGARIQRIGNDATWQSVIGGRRYQIVERRYALAVEQAGTLQLPAPRFRGRALGAGLFGGGRALTATGDALQLDVRERPAAAPRPWLPATALELQDESEAWPQEVRVGEPLTLALRLVAHGLLAEQLPELDLPGIDGAQVYPDRESAQTRDSGEWIVGERRRRFAIVASRPGELSVPALRVSWWNTVEDRLEHAELPARRLRVLPAAGAAAAIEPVAPAIAEDAMPDAGAGWRLLSLGLLLLWLVTLAWGLSRRRAAAAIAAAPATAAPAAAAPAPPALQPALASDDPARIAAALRAAAPVPAASLEAVALALDDPAQAEAVRAFERALYRGDDADAARARLRTAFAGGPRWRASARADTAGDGLPPLYR